MGGLPKQFGDRVKALRRERKLSRMRLGELIGLSERAMGDLERGKRMNSSHIEPIAIALGVSPRDLFDFEAPLPPLPAVSEAHRAIVREAISQLERLLK